MDFKALTGGASFNKARFGQSIALFEGKKATSSSSAASKLPAELSFFSGKGEGTSKDGAAKEEGSKRKKRKLEAAKEPAEEQDTTDLVDYAAILRANRIKLTGMEPPNPIVGFEELLGSRGEAGEVLQANLSKLRFETPTPVQMAAWGVMNAGRDVLACAPTGSGKTFAFLLPLLLLTASKAGQAAKKQKAGTSSQAPLTPKTLIIEPTKELAHQVKKEAEKVCKGGDWTIQVLGEEEEGALACDVLISTPLRLVHAVKEGKVDLASVQALVLDEADRLFELNFLEQTDSILAACTNPALRKGMFSATVPAGVEELAKGVMSGSGAGHIRIIVGHKDAATATIEQQLLFVNTEDYKLASLRDLIRNGGFTPPVLIFVQSIVRAKELAGALGYDGIQAACIHAELSAAERQKAVDDFEKGTIWCLIATDVMARGVDFKDVKLVILYDFPQSGASYIHRIGRTGRAGKTGRAVTFFTKDDAPYLKSIVNIMRLSGCEVPDWMLALPSAKQNDRKRLAVKPIDRTPVSRTPGSGLAGDVRVKLAKKDKRSLPSKTKKEGGKSKGGKGDKSEKDEKAPKRKKREVALDE